MLWHHVLMLHGSFINVINISILNKLPPVKPQDQHGMSVHTGHYQKSKCTNEKIFYCVLSGNCQTNLPCTPTKMAYLHPSKLMICG